MVSYLHSSSRATPARTGNRQQTRQGEILDSMMYSAMRMVNAQFPAFAQRLIDVLLLASQQGKDDKQTNFCFNASTLLKSNGPALGRILQQSLETLIKQENDEVEHGFHHEAKLNESELSLVPYEEMDNKVLLSGLSRPFEVKYADQLTALSIRMAFLLERNTIPTSRNPFRPETFIHALNQAWQQFDGNDDNHALILPFFTTELLFDFSPIYQALNETLMARGILPGSVESYRIKKTDTGQVHAGSASNALSGTQLKQQLQQWLEVEPQTTSTPGAGFMGSAGTAGFMPNRNQLTSFLAELQQRIAASTASQSNIPTGSDKPPHNVIYLQRIKQMAPKGSLSQVDEKSIDLLTKIFETVFIDRQIPQELKNLVGLLQMPVLNEALQNKEFFYQEQHPARRLLDLSAQLSLDWEQRNLPQDPLYLALKRNIAKLQKQSAQQANLFAEVVSELEEILQEEQQATEQTISEPIALALKQEKTIQSTIAAKNEVALRIGTGEVAAFIETFLEDKWVSVLTIAYTVQEEKPEALKNAVKTMDDLIWSVKPKITQEQRKEFITKLPTMLSNLNKWLNVIKWDDADRLQFFAELAETHASIVRAPLELSPERQLQISLEVAQKAAERRLEKQAQAKVEEKPEPPLPGFDELQRGMWLEIVGTDGKTSKAKLAWISPMRSLYIFSNNQKQENFSLSAEQLAESFRAGNARVLRVGGDGSHDLVANAVAHALSGQVA